MFLELLRFSSQSDSTLGLLFLNGVFQCYIIEDEKRNVKVYGETRIPSGRYPIELRVFGGFHERYTRKYPSFHKGMLWLRHVHGFENILIHTGNTDDDTAGCLIVGDTANNNGVVEGFVGSSVSTYKRVYPKIAEYLESTGGPVFIQIVDKA